MKRYGASCEFTDSYLEDEITERPNGEWVKYKDAQKRIAVLEEQCLANVAALNAANKRIAELEEKLRRI